MTVVGRFAVGSMRAIDDATLQPTAERFEILEAPLEVEVPKPDPASIALTLENISRGVSDVRHELGELGVERGKLTLHDLVHGSPIPETQAPRLRKIAGRIDSLWKSLESVALTDVAQIDPIFREMRSLGVQIAETKERLAAGKKLNTAYARVTEAFGRLHESTYRKAKEAWQLDGIALETFTRMFEAVRGGLDRIALADREASEKETDPLLSMLKRESYMRFPEWPEKDLPQKPPLAHLREELGRIPTANSGSFAELPCVKRVLDRVDAMLVAGVLEELTWNKSRIQISSGMGHFEARMNLYPSGALQALSSLAHELTHLHQTYVTCSPGMTRDEFIRANVDRYLDAELQAWRVGTELWVDLVTNGLPRELMPEEDRFILSLLRAHGSARANRNAFKEVLVGYEKKHAELLGKTWDETVGAGKPEELQRLVEKQQERADRARQIAVEPNDASEAVFIAQR